MNFFTNESIGLIATGLILVGILKFIYYYKSFNVEILRYVDASEVVILFADNIAIAGIVILVLVPPYVYSMFPYMQNNIHSSASSGERLSCYWAVLCNHIWYQAIFSILGLLFTFTRKKIFSFERLSYVFLSLAIFFIFPFFVLEIGYRLKYIIKPESIISIALTFNFILVILVATRNEIKKVKEHDYFKNTVVKFEQNSGIIHPIDTYFIGKVKSFVFFYHKNDKKSIAISAGKLESITHEP